MGHMGAADVRRPAFDSLTWRTGNALVSALARIGVGPIELLSTRDRAGGRTHTVPVVPVEHDGRRWLVAPYGAVAWVRDARRDRRVRLGYGRKTREYDVREAGAEEAGPVLKRYVAVATKTRAQFRATADSPVDDFVAEAHRHPVFELVPVSSGGVRPTSDATRASETPLASPRRTRREVQRRR